MKTPCIRVSLVLAKYPTSEGSTTYRWSTRPLADSGAWAEGRVQSIGEIRRACTSQDGDYELSRVSVTLADDDGLFRGLLDGATTQYFIGREVVIELLSEAGRAAASAWRLLFRGVVGSVQLGPNRTATLDVQDLIGSKFSSFDLERTIGVTLGAEHTNLPDDAKGRLYPIILGEHSDSGALDANGVSAEKGLLPVIYTGTYRIDGSVAPPTYLPAPSNLTATVHGTSGTTTYTYAVSTGSAYGESPRCAAVTVPNGPATLNATDYIALTWDGVTGATFYRVWGRSSINTWLDGMNNGGTYVSPETAYNDDDDQDIEKGGPNVDAGSALADDGVWDRYLVSLGCTEIDDVFASDLNTNGTPKRALLTSDIDGVEYLTSGSTGWPHANPYLDLTNPATGETIRGTYIYLRGPRSEAHKQGSVTITVNGCGMESAGDGSGTMVDEAFKAGQLFLNEHILKDGGTGYRTGTYGPLEAFSNGDKQIQTSAWAAAQTVSVNRIGGTGYKAAWAIHESMTVREWVRRFCLTFDCRLAVNAFGQLAPVVVDDLANPATGRLYREREEGVDLLDQPLAVDELENRIAYSYDYDSDAQAYRVEGLTIEDQASIAAHVPGADEGDVTPRGIYQGAVQELYCTRDETTATDSRARRLTRNKRTPRYVTHAQDLMGVEDDIGDQTRFTHRDGIGTSGDEATPLCVLAHVVQPFGVMGTTLTGVDLGRLLDNDMTMTASGPAMTGTAFEMR